MDHLLSKDKRKVAGALDCQFKKFKVLFSFECDTDIGIMVKDDTYGELAQLGEHLLCKQGVSGSIPLFSIGSVKAAGVAH